MFSFLFTRLEVTLARKTLILFIERYFKEVFFLTESWACGLESIPDGQWL